MSCGARDNINKVSASFITHTNFKRTVICSHSRVVKLQHWLFSHRHKISWFELAVVWHQHFSCCTFCYSCLVLWVIWKMIEQLPILEAEIGWLWWTKEMLRGYREMGTGCFTKTLRNKIFLLTSWFWIKKKKDLNQSCFSIFLPLCVILAFDDLHQFGTLQKLKTPIFKECFS